MSTRNSNAAADDANNNLNDILDKTADDIVCGPTCQKQKKEDELHQQYLDAQNNFKTAPDQLKNATKNYYTFSQGELGYNKLVLRELKEKSNSITLLIANNFINYLKVTKTDLDNYSNTLKDTTIVQNLNDELEQKVFIMQNALLKHRTTNTTNNRKTYYEEQQIQNLYAWKKIFKYVFYLVVACLAIALLVSPSSLSFPKKIIIIIVLALYPFYILFIAKYVMKMYSKIIFLLPKNVYANI